VKKNRKIDKNAKVVQESEYDCSYVIVENSEKMTCAEMQILRNCGQKMKILLTKKKSLL